MSPIVILDRGSIIRGDGSSEVHFSLRVSHLSLIHVHCVGAVVLLMAELLWALVDLVEMVVVLLNLPVAVLQSREDAVNVLRIVLGKALDELLLVTYARDVLVGLCVQPIKLINLVQTWNFTAPFHCIWGPPINSARALYRCLESLLTSLRV